MSRECRVEDVTGLLRQWCEGDKAALDTIVPAVYQELRRVARARLRAEREGHSLQTTALVHEVYLRLVHVGGLRFESRAQFFSIAARLMRQILVDHARRHNAGKRGAGAPVALLDEVSASVMPVQVDVLSLNRALDDLAAIDDRLSQVVQLKFFAGLTTEETASALGLSKATVEREWTLARAWLYDQLTGRAVTARPA